MTGIVTPPSSQSSSTLHERMSQAIVASVDEETRLEEVRIELYGGDDSQEPTPKIHPYVLSKADVPSDSDANLVSWDGPNDPTNPQNWSFQRKMFITIIVTLFTVNVTFASSAPSACAGAVTAYFDQPREIGYLLTSLFLCGFIFGPFFWGPGSELVGRRPVFVLTLSCYTLFHLGQALATNIQTLLITRFLSGFFAVSPLTNSAGLIFDIWDPVSRGLAVCLFCAGVFIGPILGPIIGGFVVESYLGWRWVFWVMMIFAGACALVAAAIIPETYAPVLLQQKARRMRKTDPIANAQVYAQHERVDWTWRSVLYRTLYRPVEMLATEPILLLITLYMGLVYAILYALLEAVPVIFLETRGFTPAQCGLVFLAVGFGSTFAAFMCIPLNKRYPALMVHWRGYPPPEERLFSAMIGGPLLVIGCFWLGWAGAYPSVPWYVPALGIVPIGASILFIFVSFQTYIVDTYLQYTASAFSAMTMVRSAMAAAFPLFTVQMLHNLGIQWGCTLFGLLALVLAPIPFLFYKYGARLRTKSKYAPSIDLVIAKELAAEAAAGMLENGSGEKGDGISAL